MIFQEDVVKFIASRNYDLRCSGNGRWIDQKCAADVVTVIADCICYYNSEHPGEVFRTPDIWHSLYAEENVEAIFRKPGVESTAAKNEYDKFFQQPMEMLAYAGVLEKKKQGKSNLYRVSQKELLEYIALRERNALFFLKTYIKKVLQDSGIYNLFENFFLRQDRDSYEHVKEGYSNFIRRYTKINGVTECNRIFIKVLNPLAYYYRKRGTERGHISNHPITYDMIMYNSPNFRDIAVDKPKGMTRKEYARQHPSQANDAFYKYQSVKAKRFLRIFNDNVRNSITEHMDGIHVNDKAIHMHHIFPEAYYPEICYYLENIIALTPTQHLDYAHPNGKTTEVDNEYQHLLLLSKTDRIEENLKSSKVEHIYEFANLVHVLNVGFDDDRVLEIEDMDFQSVVNAINVHYQPLKNSYRECNMYKRVAEHEE